ncbi:unnamed protein product [Sphagnum jensenii]|uniref:Endonuclease/exonuclease/phosphatase domain-containing protein n=1 Tax=Sphagnum jensenii TaxID=128206 RepID=A0ABP0VMG9_9BRYO
MFPGILVSGGQFQSRETFFAEEADICLIWDAGSDREYICHFPVGGNSISVLSILIQWQCELSKLPVDSFYCKPFRNSVMGRELCVANVDVGNGTQLTVATTHLESPCPAPPTWNQMFRAERLVQAKEALALLKDVPNAIFGGDMNWDDKQDGKPPLPPGWFDAWLQLCPHQKRLDRIYCQLHNFEVESIEMVGTTPIPDLTFQKELKVKKQVELTTLPVLASDHFGLLLKMRHKSK